MSPSAKDPLAHLTTLVSPSEYFYPDSPSYTSESQTWSQHRNEQPAIVIRPQTISTLSAVIKYLASTTLDYKIRSQGFGSASARDVVISMTAFNGFSYDSEAQTVTLDAGNTWRRFYEEMEKVAPKHMIVAARTPAIGVGGSTLCSGFSWMSHEYGCVSDASNLLDVQVVLADGTICWASEYPDLLWAMRGTEGGFAVAVNFKFAVKEFPENGHIWGGPILLPRNKVKEVAKGIAAMCSGRKDVHPKVALFLYVIKKDILKLLGADDDMLVVHAYCGLGEEHGRQEFRWALDIEGAIDQTKGNMTMRQQCALQDGLDAMKGQSSGYWTPMALAQITEDHVLNAVQWWNNNAEQGLGSVKDNGYLLFELFSCRDNLTSRGASAWPRPVGFKHMLLIGSGAGKQGSEEEIADARRWVKDVGPRMVLGGEEAAKEMLPIPNAIEDFFNLKKMYGENWSRLREVKAKYDPQNRLKGWIPPA